MQRGAPEEPGKQQEPADENVMFENRSFTLSL
jgi:hypothetical protein